MRCYCLTHPGQPLQLEERPVPQPAGTEVLVKVRAAGLCHSDLHLWEGHYDMGGGKRMTLVDRGITLPLVLSHEVVGEVVAGGDAAGALAIGQQVLVHPWIGCGECAACRRGEDNICARPQALGIKRAGGFADYLLVPHPRWLVDAAGLDPAASAPLACAGVTTYSAIRKFGARIHEAPLVVIGAGGLGLMALGVLRALGGRGALVLDIDPAKRDAALAAGALAAFDPRADDILAQLNAATDGGARAVLDLVGASATVQLAIASCGRGGQVVVCGLMGGELTLALPMLPMKPLTLQGSYVGSLAEQRELVALVQRGALAPMPVTRRPLDEANAALADLAAGRVVGRTVLLP